MATASLPRRVWRTTAERFRPRAAALATAVVLAVGYLPDGTLADDVDLVVAFLGTAALLELAAAARRTDGVNAASVTAAMGVVPLVGGAYFLSIAAGVGPELALGTVGVVTGTWMVLDGATAYRAGVDLTPADGDVDVDAEAVAMTHASLLVPELRKGGPRTAPELAEACDLTESRVADALERMTAAGLVEETGAGYTLDETELGASGLARRAVRRLLAPARRLRD